MAVSISPAKDHQATILVALLGFLVAPSLSAPSPSHPDRTMGGCGTQCRTAECKPWFNPCSNEHSMRHHHSHSRRSTRNLVRDQTHSVTIQVEKVILPELKQLYALTPRVNPPKQRLPWLANKRFLAAIKRDEKKALVHFYKILQTYAGTFYRLSQMKIETEADFDVAQRCALFKSLLDHTKRLLCETRDDILDKGLQEPLFVDDADMKIELAAVASVTMGSAYDMAVVQRYKKFLKQASRRLFKNRNKNKKGRKEKKPAAKAPAKKAKKQQRKVIAKSS